MNKIDTSMWGNFLVDDLFDIHPTTAYDETNKTLFEEDGVNPVVVNSSYNNGIGGYTNKNNTEVGGIITFSDTTTADAIFYQDDDFVGYPHVQGMYPKLYKEKWNSYTLRFFATVFKVKALSLNLNYVNKFTRDYAKSLIIKLPVVETGEPNWAYMEKYIQDIDMKANEALVRLKAIIKLGKVKLDISNWRPFHLYDLFTIDPGNKFDKVKMKTDKPCISFVGRSSVNNGITEIVNKIDDNEPYQAGYLTLALGGAYLGSCFIQKEPFYTSQNVNVLIPNKPMSDESKLFIATTIFVESQLHYKAFIKELNKHVKTDFTIYLPAISEKEPDWEYMENYMRSILKTKQSDIYNLRAAI